MEESFWRQRWETGRIGFHQNEINPDLKTHLDLLRPRAGDGCMLVPLCGKSSDLMFLAREGFSVAGVEFVEQAIREFFREHNLLFQEFPDGCFQGISPPIAERIALWRRDFFTLRTQELPRVRAVYDRAALIALPAPLRLKYAAQITELARPGALMLLITLNFDQAAKGEGPPHAVLADEIQTLYGTGWSVGQVGTRDVRAELPELATGLQRLDEQVWFLRRHHPAPEN